jgi:hypothetical protein
MSQRRHDTPPRSVEATTSASIERGGNFAIYLAADASGHCKQDPLHSLRGLYATTQLRCACGISFGTRDAERGAVHARRHAGLALHRVSPRAGNVRLRTDRRGVIA